jgi:hypothetical protein
MQNQKKPTIGSILKNVVDGCESSLTNSNGTAEQRQESIVQAASFIRFWQNRAAKKAKDVVWKAMHDHDKAVYLKDAMNTEI